MAYRTLSLMLFFLLLAAPAAAQQVLDKVVAVVNGEMITLGEINGKLAQIEDQLPIQPSPQAQAAMLQQVRESLLQARINEILVRHEIERLKLTVEPADIESHIRAMREERGITEEELRSQLALQGKTRQQLMDEIKQEILKNQLINYMVHRKAMVTDQDIDNFIASGGRASALPSSASSPAAQMNTSRVHLAVIMLRDEATATRLHKEVTGGKISFAEAARKNTVGPAAESGGDLGVLALVDLGPELRNAAQNMKPGDISKPFRLGDGYAFVQMLDQGSAAGSPATSPSIPASNYDRDAIRAQLKKMKTEELLLEYLARLKSKALIKINW
ncbi:SurA N-terminal domain-containing protein [Megalodesulfovibrio paquesii]